MTNNYYHATDVAEMLHLSISEVYNKLKTGELKGHKVRRKWLINKDQDSFKAIAVNNASNQKKESIKFIRDNAHHEEILLKVMAGVQTSLKIACATLDNFVVHTNGGNSMPLCDFLTRLIRKKIKVQIICMEAQRFFNWVKNNKRELTRSNYFELYENKHCHMKIFVFDDERAYMGSANLTSAALDKGKYARNYEAGILVQGGKLFDEITQQYNLVLNAEETELIC